MIFIPENELIITFARSSGKGGQNVNKTSTKVTIHWPIGNSVVLSDEQKGRVRTKLVNRINNNDELVITSEEERSQLQNKELAINRLQSLVGSSLQVPKKRKATKPTKASKLRRLRSKKIRSQIKAQRRQIE